MPTSRHLSPVLVAVYYGSVVVLQYIFRALSRRDHGAR